MSHILSLLKTHFLFSSRLYSFSEISSTMSLGDNSNPESVRLPLASDKGGNQMPPYQSPIYLTFRRYIWICPLLSALFFPLFCVSFYAAYHGHLEPILQFVSDSGTYTPSAGYFSMCLDVMAILGFISLMARYKQQRYYLTVVIPKLMNSGEAEYSPRLLYRLEKANFVSFVLALVSNFGLLMLANFRCNEAFLMHSIGAIGMIISSLLCTGYTIYICRQLSSNFHIESAPLSMTICLIIQVFTFFSLFAFSILGGYQYGEDILYNEYKRLHWTQEQPGYWWHVLGTASEWILLNFYCIFCLSLSRRMRLFTDWNKVDF